MAARALTPPGPPQPLGVRGAAPTLCRRSGTPLPAQAARVVAPQPQRVQQGSQAWQTLMEVKGKHCWTSEQGRATWQLVRKIERLWSVQCGTACKHCTPASAMVHDLFGLHKVCSAVQERRLPCNAATRCQGSL